MCDGVARSDFLVPFLRFFSVLLGLTCAFLPAVPAPRSRSVRFKGRVFTGSSSGLPAGPVPAARRRLRARPGLRPAGGGDGDADTAACREAGREAVPGATRPPSSPTGREGAVSAPVCSGERARAGAPGVRTRGTSPGDDQAGSPTRRPWRKCGLLEEVDGRSGWRAVAGVLVRPGADQPARGHGRGAGARPDGGECRGTGRVSSPPPAPLL